ncbi:MAG: T9SS type A sorting domain-containing protein [Flammeovirgaceae bacterium]|nr:T9SS type A sorting domain-containing protein [Flammeovirgaceae bacterium]
MKIFILISTSLLFVIGSLSMATPKDTKPEITTITNDNLLVLKANRKFKGAEIEVFSSSGYLVTSKKLNKRKVIIDFKNVRTGAYLIRVKKGKTQEEFSFTKQ